MVNTAIRVGYEKKVSTEYFESHPYHELEMIEQMRVYKTSIPMANRCFFYNKGKDYVIGSESVYIKKYFIDALGANSSELKEWLIRILDGLSNGKVAYRSDFDVTDYRKAVMLIAVPVTTKSRYDSYVIYVLNNKSLAESFGRGYNLDEYGFYVCDINGSLLLSGSDLPLRYEWNAGLHAFIADPSAAFVTLEISDVEYSICQYADYTLGLRILSSVPKARLEQPVESFYQAFRVVVAVVGVLLIVMLIANIYFNYKPISRIIKSLRGHLANGADVSEIETITMAFNERVVKQREMMDRIAEQQLLLTDMMLKNLLDGKKIARGDLESFGLPLSGACYCVVVTPEITIYSVDLMELSDRLYRACGCTACMTQSYYEHHMIFICALPRGDRQMRENLAEAINALLQESKPGINLRMGVGSAETDLTRLRGSYLSAVIALEQGIKEGSTLFEDIVSTYSIIENYPSESVLCFIQSVKHGDCESAMEEFDRIEAYITQNVHSFMIEQYMCYDILNNFIKTVMKLEIPLVEREIEKLLMFNNLKDIREGLSELTAKVCELVNQRRQASGKQLMEEIKKYIDEQYADFDLSMISIAEHFDISIYTVSGMFKQAYGIGFREYITNIRMEKGREFLRSTKRSVKDIANSVGIRDASYFIKLFRESHGLTPSKYREEAAGQVGGLNLIN